jgi:glutamate transport system permease protein
MSDALIGDALGPRARRRVLVGSVVSALALAAVVALVIRRLAANGQLDPELYEVFSDPALPPLLGEAFAALARVALVSMVLAVAFGSVLALGRLSLSAPVRWAAAAYVQFFRALPVLMLILFSRFGLPRLGLPTFEPSTYVILALVAYNSAVLGEIFRAGILSLDRGQSEAAYAVGLRYWQAMRLVIVPQGARRMIPAIVSQLVTLIKDASLGYIVSFEEPLTVGRRVGELFNNRPQMLAFVALLYVLVCFSLSRLARYLERRQRRRYRAGAIRVAGGPEDLIADEAPVPARV